MLCLVQLAVDQPTRTEYIDRIRRSFEKVNTSAEKYAILMGALGFIERKDQIIVPSQTGERLFSESLPDVVADTLLSRVVGVSDVLIAVREAPLRVGLIHDQVSPRYGWTRQNQVRYRVQWMQVAMLLEPVKARYPAYRLGPAGVLALECLPSLGSS